MITKDQRLQKRLELYLRKLYGFHGVYSDDTNLLYAISNVTKGDTVEHNLANYAGAVLANYAKITNESFDHALIDIIESHRYIWGWFINLLRTDLKDESKLRVENGKTFLRNFCVPKWLIKEVTKE